MSVTTSASSAPEGLGNVTRMIHEPQTPYQWHLIRLSEVCQWSQRGKASRTDQGCFTCFCVKKCQPVQAGVVCGEGLVSVHCPTQEAVMKYEKKMSKAGFKWSQHPIPDTSRMTGFDFKQLFIFQNHFNLHSKGLLKAKK